MIDIDILYNSVLWEQPDRLEQIIHDSVYATLKHLAFETINSELSIVLTDDNEIRTLNGQWRSQLKATNVLSFPAFDIAAGDKPGPLLGDIIIAYEIVRQEAEAENKTFEAHLIHLVVHGLLHLLGYDHIEEEEAEMMERLERDILRSLAIPDPYAVSL